MVLEFEDIYNFLIHFFCSRRHFGLFRTLVYYKIYSDLHSVCTRLYFNGVVWLFWQWPRFEVFSIRTKKRKSEYITAMYSYHHHHHIIRIRKRIRATCLNHFEIWQKVNIFFEFWDLSQSSDLDPRILTFYSIQCCPNPLP